MIRTAGPGDVDSILTLVHELAVYERAPNAVTASATDLREALFGTDPRVWCLLAEDAGEIVGFAVWFTSFSTWLGRHGIYLEDLFVRSAARGRGHGRALIGALARIACERGYGRLEWAVLDWNAPAIGFYRGTGADALVEWTGYRVSGGALAALAAGSPAPPSGPL